MDNLYEVRDRIDARNALRNRRRRAANWAATITAAIGTAAAFALLAGKVAIVAGGVK